MAHDLLELQNVGAKKVQAGKTVTLTVSDDDGLVLAQYELSFPSTYKDMGLGSHKSLVFESQGDLIELIECVKDTLLDDLKAFLAPNFA